jgi:release factor glutamine methyltransferase
VVIIYLDAYFSFYRFEMDIWSVTRLADRLEEMDIALDREAMSLARWIWLEILSLAPHLEIELNDGQLHQLEQTYERLMHGEPAQYIAGHAWFYGVKFQVTRDVLIPRPETEELVEWVLSDCKKMKQDKIQILDIGTGSGCIAIILKKQLGDRAVVKAIDISKRALSIAALNSQSQQVQIELIHQDFLTKGFDGLGAFDIIVSNPPYVSKEIAGHEIIHRLKYEPDAALYPIGNDPDIFYKKICAEAGEALHSGGAGYVEVNEFRAQEIEGYFKKSQWGGVEMRLDLQGMPRMLKAFKPFAGYGAALG